MQQQQQEAAASTAAAAASSGFPADGDGSESGSGDTHDTPVSHAARTVSAAGAELRQLEEELERRLDRILSLEEEVGVILNRDKIFWYVLVFIICDIVMKIIKPGGRGPAAPAAPPCCLHRRWQQQQQQQQAPTATATTGPRPRPTRGDASGAACAARGGGGERGGVAGAGACGGGRSVVFGVWGSSIYYVCIERNPYPFKLITTPPTNKQCIQRQRDSAGGSGSRRGSFGGCGSR